MIEALACGTPVIGTPCGATPEIVQDSLTGFVRVGVPRLATALGDVARLDRRTCRQAAQTDFSTERMVADHLALYRTLLDPRAETGKASTVPVSRALMPLAPSSRRHQDLVPSGGTP